jgi:hypothetical protein
MKDGLRFVDCDMHIMGPPNLFERYLEPRFRERVVLPVGKDGRPCRGTTVIDGLPTTRDAELQQYRKRSRPMEGAHLYGFTENDVAKADSAAAKNPRAGGRPVAQP